MIDIKPTGAEAPTLVTADRQSRYWLPALLLLAFLVRLAWAWLLPFDKAPDEGTAHIRAITFYLNHFRLPTRPEILSNEAGAYGGMSPLPYLLHCFFGLFAAKGVPLQQQILLPRLGSVVAGTGVVWAAYLGSRRLFPQNRWLHWGIPLCLAVQPQLVFISAYLNSDIVSVFISTLLIALWPEVLKTGMTWKNALYLGIIGGLLALCKLNALSLVPPTLIVVGMAVYRHKQPLATAAVRGLAGAGLALALSVWYYVRNYLVIGDVFGYRSMWEVAKLYLHKNPAHIELGLTMKQSLVESPWGALTFKSSWGVYDYMSLFLPKGLYLVLAVVILLGTLSSLWLLVRRKSVENLTPGLMVSILLGFGLSIALMAWTSYFNDWQPQGRYHFPVILGEAVMVLVGLVSLARSERWQQAVVGVSVLGTFTVMAYSYLFVLWPLYR